MQTKPLQKYCFWVCLSNSVVVLWARMPAESQQKSCFGLCSSSSFGCVVGRNAYEIRTKFVLLSISEYIHIILMVVSWTETPMKSKQKCSFWVCFYLILFGYSGRFRMFCGRTFAWEGYKKQQHNNEISNMVQPWCTKTSRTDTQIASFAYSLQAKRHDFKEHSACKFCWKRCKVVQAWCLQVTKTSTRWVLPPFTSGWCVVPQSLKNCYSECEFCL